MKRRKFTAKEKTALIVLIVLMIAVIGIGAFIIVNNVNNANRAAADTSHTTIKITTPPDEETVAENGATEKSAETVKKDKKDNKNSSASSVKSFSKKSSAKSSKASKTKSVKAPKKSNKPKKAPDTNTTVIPVVTPNNNTSHKSDDKCVINGVTCYVGDTISVTLNLKCAKTLVNYQGYSTFNTDYLKCVSVKANVGIVNNKDDKIYYNASDINGMDFSENGTIYTARFTVKKSGSTSIKNTMQILTDMNDNEVSVSSVKDTLNIFG